MSGKNINFNDKKMKKSTFYKNKAINNIEDINVNDILVNNNVLISIMKNCLLKYFNINNKSLIVC